MFVTRKTPPKKTKQTNNVNKISQFIMNKLINVIVVSLHITIYSIKPLLRDHLIKLINMSPLQLPANKFTKMLTPHCSSTKMIKFLVVSYYCKHICNTRETLLFRFYAPLDQIAIAPLVINVIALYFICIYAQHCTQQNTSVYTFLMATGVHTPFLTIKLQK